MTHRTSPLVLVVDDDIVTAKMLSHILNKEGFSTAMAATGAEAVALGLELRPSLILLDVNLPDMNGFDVCAKLKESTGDLMTPVIFVSAVEDVQAKVRGFDAGGVDYVTKPVAAPEVIARVRTHIRLKNVVEKLARLQAERIDKLAAAQQMTMPSEDSLPQARFYAVVSHIHGAGGDFYDVIEMGDSIFDYVVADACGHDVDASFWTAAFKALIYENASAVNLPKNILEACNSSLHRILPSGAFFTVVYARLNRSAGIMTIVNAAHPPAIYIPRVGPVVTVDQSGDLLGAFPEAYFGVTEQPCHYGDRFLFYTDGLAEAVGDLYAGVTAICNACTKNRDRPLKEMIRLIRSEVLKDVVVQDDVLLLGVEI
ncbi:MAG: response regulator [Spartobacteria bacterium]|nr:response regulator [Spartobacteria bacterium]